jgi:hypothetical protein
MTESPITFAVLDQFLRGLGFVQAPIPQGIGYRHAATDLIILLPAHAETDAVGPRHLTIVRKYLDEYGLVPRADFDRRVRAQAVAV